MATVFCSVWRRRRCCDYRSSRGDDTKPRAVSSATKSPARALTVHVLELLLKDKRTAPARRSVASTDRYWIWICHIYITMYRDRLQAKDIKLSLSLSLLTQFLTGVFPPITHIVRWESRITYFDALKKKTTYPLHCAMWQATVVYYVSMFRHPDFQWRHHLRGSVAAVTSQLPKIPVPSSTSRGCYIMLGYAAAQVGGRIVLLLLWNVSNAVPKLLSKDEPNRKKSKLNRYWQFSRL